MLKEKQHVEAGSVIKEVDEQLKKIVQQFSCRQNPPTQQVQARLQRRVDVLSRKLKNLTRRYKKAIADITPIEVKTKAVVEREYNDKRAALKRKLKKAEGSLFACRLDVLYPRMDMSFMHQAQNAFPGLPRWAFFRPFSQREPTLCRYKIYELLMGGKIGWLGSFAGHPLDWHAGGFSESQNNRLPSGDWEWWYHQVVCLESNKSALDPTHSHQNIPIDEEIDNRMRDWGNRNRWARDFLVEFNGAIPAATRKLMQSLKDKLDDIILVTEAPEWKPDPTTIRMGDPLLIGRLGWNCWLLDAFDTTPAEEELKKLFTHKSK